LTLTWSDIITISWFFADIFSRALKYLYMADELLLDE